MKAEILESFGNEIVRIEFNQDEKETLLKKLESVGIEVKKNGYGW